MGNFSNWLSKSTDTSDCVTEGLAGYILSHIYSKLDPCLNKSFAAILNFNGIVFGVRISTRLFLAFVEQFPFSLP